uniref:Gypsy retrotransposon integrase-like protein 1 n=1 Tax=Poecilia formosa TaxID=48698 RepID=A0A096LZT0_POEFO
MQTLSSQQLSAAQKEDTALSILHSWKEAGSLPTKDEVAIESPAVRKYWLCWPQIELHQGVLYYHWENVYSLKPSLLLLVPASLQMEVMQACHDPPLSGHLGETKTLQSFHWYGMGSDLHKYIQQCPRCKGLKSSSPSKRAKLQSYQAGAPVDQLHLDILGPFPISSSGNKYILVIMDQFMRWVEAFPVPDHGAETTARMLVNIRCYVDQNQKNWDEHLNLLTAAYCSAQNSSTGFSPNMMILWREVHQPQDLWLGLAERTWSEKDTHEYAHDLEKTLGEVHDMARQHLRGAQIRQKRTHDLRAKECSYNIGDLVYVKD